MVALRSPSSTKAFEFSQPTFDIMDSLLLAQFLSHEQDVSILQKGSISGRERQRDIHM